MAAVLPILEVVTSQSVLAAVSYSYLRTLCQVGIFMVLRKQEVGKNN